MTAPAAGSEGAPQGDPAGATPPNGDPNGTPPEGEPLGEGGIKALQAERARAEAAEARVKEFEKTQQAAERAKLSTDERAALEHKEATERATTAEQKLARLEVAIDKKLPTELAAAWSVRPRGTRGRRRRAARARRVPVRPVDATARRTPPRGSAFRGR
jgi:hypothetical protein